MRSFCQIFFHKQNNFSDFFLSFFIFKILLRIFINFLLFVSIADFSSATIRNVSLVVDPPAVRRGQYATLFCMYELDNKPLYSVKFYRGYREFYRYSPGEYPASKVFAFEGINVDVSEFYFLFPYCLDKFGYRINNNIF